MLYAAVAICAVGNLGQMFSFVNTWLVFFQSAIISVLTGSVAEWSKALDLGSSLLGGVGSNPTAANFYLSSD